MLRTGLLISIVHRYTCVECSIYSMEYRCQAISALCKADITNPLLEKSMSLTQIQKHIMY